MPRTPVTNLPPEVMYEWAARSRAASGLDMKPPTDPTIAVRLVALLDREARR